jgi:XrtJ-associated TM-motif-TM protein
MKVWLIAVLVVGVVVCATPALAQNGCVNSPENPTAILALVGASSGVFVALRGRLRRRK